MIGAEKWIELIKVYSYKGTDSTVKCNDRKNTHSQTTTNEENERIQEI